MMPGRAIACLGLAAGLIVCGAMDAPVLLAATPQSLDAPWAEVALSTVEISPDVITSPSEVARKPVLSGNPLWATPLSLLTATRERPIFSLSRRPPVPLVAAPPPVEPAKPPPLPPVAERPPLSLLGTVVSETDSIAVFNNTTTSNVVRLRVGEIHAGWILRSVIGREATLQKDSEMAILTFPPRDSVASAGTAVMPPPVSLPVRRRP
jgi:general secretion pathway protein N